MVYNYLMGIFFINFLPYHFNDLQKDMDYFLIIIHMKYHQMELYQFNFNYLQLQLNFL